MTLEVLFARAGQCGAFLRMCACGVAAGAALQLSGWLHGKKRWLGNAWDVVWAAAITVAATALMLQARGGVRLYAFVGLALGAAVYGLGPRRMAAWAARQISARKKERSARQEKASAAENTNDTRKQGA